MVFFSYSSGPDDHGQKVVNPFTFFLKRENAFDVIDEMLSRSRIFQMQTLFHLPSDRVFLVPEETSQRETCVSSEPDIKNGFFQGSWQIYHRHFFCGNQRFLFTDWNMGYFQRFHRMKLFSYGNGKSTWDHMRIDKSVTEVVSCFLGLWVMYLKIETIFMSHEVAIVDVWLTAVLHMKEGGT